MDSQLEELPEAYARYLSLRRSGLGRAAAARALGLSETAMDAFVELAHAKLAAIDGTDSDPSQPEE